MNTAGQTNQVLYVFQNSHDAAIVKCASTMIGMGRADLAKDILANARIDAKRIAEMQMRSTVIGVSYGQQQQKARSGASW